MCTALFYWRTPFLFASGVILASLMQGSVYNSPVVRYPPKTKNCTKAVPTMISRRTAALLLAAVMVFAAPAPHAAQEVMIGAGSVTGLYYGVAQNICSLVNRYSNSKYQCSGRPALGSVFNINAVSGGLLDFGMAQSDRNWQATLGRSDWQGKPDERLRSVFSLHPETVMLVARRDAGIDSVADLIGKRVNIGNPGSGQRGNAEDVLRIHGVDIATDLKASEWQQHEASRAIVEGRIDAFFYTAGNPSDAIRLPATETALDLIPLNGERVLHFVSGKTYYMMTEIPAGTYPGVAKAIPTYGVRATLVSSSNTPDELVYDVVRIVFEHLDELRRLHPALRDLTPNIMLSSLSAPFHPGAERYYKERGWILSDTND